MIRKARVSSGISSLVLLHGFIYSSVFYGSLHPTFVFVFVGLTDDSKYKYATFTLALREMY